MGFHQSPVTYVSQVNLKVQDLERSLKFYQDIIGFQVYDRSERSASLTTDGEQVILTLEQPDHVIPAQGRTTGLYHFAILLPERRDLAQVIQHLSDSGIRLGASDHLVSEAIYLDDPDGNGIEIYRDRTPGEWTWNGGNVEMTVDPLDFGGLLNELGTERWNGLPSGTVMGHIHLHVAELQKTEEFYVKGLGFEVVNRFGAQALFISNGKYHHHIGLNTWNGVGAPRPQHNSVGLQSFVIQYPSEEVREQVIANLREIGASVEINQDKVITSDPSGNTVHLMA